MAGTEQVVLGDLVNCKENSTAKITEFVGSEYPEDCSGGYDSSNENEISVDIHEDINSCVKVSRFILAICRVMLVIN